MERGFVHLWRKSLDSRVFKNAELWQLWTWCLMKASHKPQYCEIVTGKGRATVAVNTGSFVFGRNQAAKELGQKPSGLWKRCLLLQTLGNLNIQSNNHYSIISIVNWELYQFSESKSDSQSDNQVTAMRQPSDTYKNDKNAKKKKKDFSSSGPTDHPPAEPEAEEGPSVPLKDIPEPTKPKKPEGYKTKKGRYLRGKMLEGFNAFWVAWNGTCPRREDKNDAADVWMDLEWSRTDADFNAAFLQKLIHGAAQEAARRPAVLARAGGIAKMCAGWLRLRRWEVYEEYKPPAGYAPPVLDKEEDFYDKQAREERERREEAERYAREHPPTLEQQAKLKAMIEKFSLGDKKDGKVIESRGS